MSVRHFQEWSASNRAFTDKGLHKGQLFTWNRYSDVATAGTTLTETTTMPQTNFSITQGTGTIGELGNSVPYTEFLDNLSKHPVQEIINKVLKNDAKKAFDAQAWAQFYSTPLKIAPFGTGTVGTDTSAIVLSTTGTQTVTNSVSLHKNHIKSIVDAMKMRNIPPYAGDEYFGISKPTTWRPVKNDLEAVYQYRDEGFQMIYRGEIGKYEGVRFIEETYIPSGNYNSGPYGSPSSFTAWTNAQSDWAFFFGDDTVAEAIVLPEEIRGQIPTDYGRSRGIAWYYEGGFALVQPDPLQARILHWSSAA